MARLVSGSIVALAIVGVCGADARAGGSSERARVIATWTVDAHGVGSGLDARAGDLSFWMIGDRGSIVGTRLVGGALVVGETIHLEGAFDTEEARALPSGGFLVADESGPSLLYVDEGGAVRARYGPSDVLPSVLSAHRKNRGFEALALSADGSTAWLATQSPLGDANDPRFSASRVIRVLQLDVSDPMHARLTGELAVVTDEDAKITAAASVDDDRLLLLQRRRAGASVILVDLRAATNLVGTPLESSLDLEDVSKGPAALGVSPAGVMRIFDTGDVPELEGQKLEGLALLDDATLAVSNDDDFVEGATSRVWTIRLATPVR